MFQPREGWKPVGGNSLEYLDSGFRITLRTDPSKTPYILHDPDGRKVGDSAILGYLQGQAEDRAKEREQFKLPPGSEWNWRSMFGKNKA